MTRSVVTLRPEMNVLAAAEVLVERRISGAPVVDDAGSLLGILSEHDCLAVIASEAYDGKHVHLTQDVSDVMTRECKTAAPDTDLQRLAGLFVDEHIRRVPILENGKLVGIVSRRDILLGMPQLHA